MSFTTLNTDLNIIQALADEPNDVGGLSAAQLKAKFDEAANIIKTFINNTLLNELEGINAAGNLGIEAIENMTATTVQAALEELKTNIADAWAGVLTPGSVGTTELADEAVTSAKIADANVTADKIAGGAVSAAKLASSAVETAKIKDANVTTAKIADANVTAAKLASNAVTEAKINSGAVTAGKIANNAVETAKIKDANVTAAKLASNAVETAKIKDGNVTQAKLAANAVSTVYTATLDHSWTASGGVYYNDVSVSGLLTTDTIFVDLNATSTTAATVANQIDAWAEIFRFSVPSNGTLRAWAVSQTTVDIPLKIIAVRR